MSRRWSDGIECPRCGSDNIQNPTKHRTMPYRCRPCQRYFSVRTDTPLADSNIPLSDWGLAIYYYSTCLKGMASMKLHRELGITQKSAWHMAHRIREMFDLETDVFEGPAEADETYIGGSEENRPLSKRSGKRGIFSKTPVAGVLDRASNMVKTKVVPGTDKRTLQGFVHSATDQSATVYTDEHLSYVGMRRNHESVRHSASEYVRGQAHTQGLDGFWSQVKRGMLGVHHWWSRRHLHRYMKEFEGRYNMRSMDTRDIMGLMVSNGVGKRLRYRDLVGSDWKMYGTQLPLMDVSERG